MTKSQIEQRSVHTDVGAEDFEEIHAIELPAREAFSLVLSSPTFLHAGRVIEAIVVPAEPAPDVVPAA